MMPAHTKGLRGQALGDTESTLPAHSITRPARLQRNRPVMHTEPDVTGILTESQLVDLGRIKNGLWKIEEFIGSVNALAADAGLEIRPIPTNPVTLAENDISRIAFAHELAENRIRAAAFSAVERMAA